MRRRLSEPATPVDDRAVLGTLPLDGKPSLGEMVELAAGILESTETDSPVWKAAASRWLGLYQIMRSSQGAPKLGSYEQRHPTGGVHPRRRPNGQWAPRNRRPSGSDPLSSM